MKKTLLLVVFCFAWMTSGVQAASEPVRLEVHYAANCDTADWATVTVPGTTIELTARILGELTEGFTSNGLPSLYATIVSDPVEPDLTFSEVSHGTIYWGPKGHNVFKGSYAITSREFDRDRRDGKIVFFLPATTEEPPTLPLVESQEPGWEPPEELKYKILMVVSGLGMMSITHRRPEFVGDEVVIQPGAQVQKLLGNGFGARWSMTTTIPQPNLEGNSGPIAPYTWGKWSPWENGGSYKPGLDVYLNPCWGETSQGTNTLVFGNTFWGPVFSLRSYRAGDEIKNRTFCVYWGEDGWTWVQLE